MKPSPPEFIAYRVPSHRYVIEEFPVVKMTDKIIVVKKVGWDNKPREVREHLRSWYGQWFKTRAEAVAHVREKATRDISNANITIDHATAAIERLRGEPE